MERQFVPFDPKVIAKEMASLPDDDQVLLRRAIERYADADPDDIRPADVVKYGAEGRFPVFRLRHTNSKGQGRLLFFRPGTRRQSSKGMLTEVLVVLLIYKKETQEVPSRHLRTASNRIDHYLEGK